MTDSNGVKPSNEELLPCPFCGSTPTLEPKGLGKIRAIVCTERPCIGSGLFIACNDDRVESAIAAWNTRAELQRQQQPDVSAIHTGKMTPRDEDLHEIMRLASREICDLSITQIGRLNTLSAMYFGYLAKTEYERRQPKASVPAELPEPVRRLLGYAGKQRREVSNPCITAREAITIANWIQAAAYGRGQSQTQEPPTC